MHRYKYVIIPKYIFYNNRVISFVSYNIIYLIYTNNLLLLLNSLTKSISESSENFIII